MNTAMQDEHQTWGPKVFGGNYADQRDEQRALADLPRYEAELARLNELCVYDRSLEADAAYVGRLVQWTRERLDFFGRQRGEARRKALADAQENEVRARHGLPPKPRELSPDAYRDEVHRQELAALAAQPKPTKAEQDAVDPHGPNAKALKKALEDSLDLRLKAKRGEPVIDAITALRNAGPR